MFTRLHAILFVFSTAIFPAVYVHATDPLRGADKFLEKAPELLMRGLGEGLGSILWYVAFPVLIIMVMLKSISLSRNSQKFTQRLGLFGLLIVLGVVIALAVLQNLQISFHFILFATFFILAFLAPAKPKCNEPQNGPREDAE